MNKKLLIILYIAFSVSGLSIASAFADVSSFEFEKNFADTTEGTNYKLINDSYKGLAYWTQKITIPENLNSADKVNLALTYSDISSTIERWTLSVSTNADESAENTVWKEIKALPPSTTQITTNSDITSSTIFLYKE
jgi:hypothetical protein